MRTYAGTCLRLAASVGLILHLTAVLLAPNRASLLLNPIKAGEIPYYRANEGEQSWVDRYLAPLGLLSTFAYFAPDPATGPAYLEYEVQSNLGDEIARGSFPEAPSPFFWNDRQNRRTAIMYFMLQYDTLPERMLVPWLCRQHPGADRIRLYRRTYKMPSIIEVTTGQKVFGDLGDTDRRWMVSAFCNAPRGST